MGLDVGWAVRWLTLSAQAMAEHRVELIELDRPIGDSDHGENMDRGFKAVMVKLAEAPPETPGAALKLTAMTLMSKVGGAAGPLYGTAFLRAATALGDSSDVDAATLAAALQAARDGIVVRGKAESGDKTMVDAWTPAIEAAAAAAAAGDGDVSAWSTCSNTANSVYRSYVLTNNGAVPGYNHFTTGFRIHFARTAEADSKKANAYMAGYRLIDSIGNGAAYCGFSDYVSVSPKRQREIAYCTRSVLNYVAEGGVSQDAKRDLMVGNIVTYHLPGRIGTRTTAATFDVDSEAPGICANRYYVSPFMQAISAYTLIQYYEEVNPDPAIHESIRWTADWIWANAYMPDKKTFWYQNCKDTVAEPWPATVGGGPSLPRAAVDLNLLFVKLYIWLYRNGSSCGDTTYRDKADILFDEGVRLGNTFLGYDGKHFNQNYTWSFDYVAMRKLPAPTCS